MRCPDCGSEKHPTEFPRKKSSKSGRGKYCKECHNRRGRESVKRNGGARHYHLKQRYGLSAAEVKMLKAAQGGVCPVCREREAVHVDHDHATKRVRGILCESCNGFLGAFGDDTAIIQAAIEYLEKPR